MFWMRELALRGSCRALPLSVMHVLAGVAYHVPCSWYQCFLLPCSLGKVYLSFALVLYLSLVSLFLSYLSISLSISLSGSLSRIKCIPFSFARPLPLPFRQREGTRDNKKIGASRRGQHAQSQCLATRQTCCREDHRRELRPG